MDHLKLAIQSGLPLIAVRTDDVVNIEEVLAFLAEEHEELHKGEGVIAMNFGEEVTENLKFPKQRVIYTSSKVKTMAALYRIAVDQGKTIVFVNAERNVLHFDGGTVIPPKELVLHTLSKLELDAENNATSEEILTACGGLTLKDIGEVLRMTMTRDSTVTQRGIAETRSFYSSLQGITQVQTNQNFYQCPDYLAEWVKENKTFFLEPVHANLTPRGLLFPGPPGTGKTEGAKYIAAQFGIPLYRLDLGTMMGRYVGDSEGNLNAALAQVDQVEPCVILFDEVEKVFKASSDSGVTSRMLSQLLWWLQEHRTKVFTVMTTNDRSAIPPELFREGRIDRSMDFHGLSGYSEANAFGQKVLKLMFQQMKLEAPSETKVLVPLGKEIKSLCTKLEQASKGQEYSGYIPQAKVTALVYSFIRQYMSNNKDTIKGAVEAASN